MGLAGSWVVCRNHVLLVKHELCTSFSKFKKEDLGARLTNTRITG